MISPKVVAGPSEASEEEFGGGRGGGGWGSVS